MQKFISKIKISKLQKKEKKKQTKTSIDNSQEEPSGIPAPVNTKSQHEATLFMDMMVLTKRQINQEKTTDSPETDPYVT